MLTPLGDLVAALVAHPVQEDVVHGQAVHPQGRVLAVAGDEPVDARLAA
jgi:hypothetical protein